MIQPTSDPLKIVDLPVNDVEPPTRVVVILRKVFFQHSLAKTRLIPRNFLTLRPRLRRNDAIHYVGNFHVLNLATSEATMNILN